MTALLTPSRPSLRRGRHSRRQHGPASRLVRATLAAAAGMAAVVAVSAGIGLAITPSVADAEARVQAGSAAHETVDDGGPIPARFAAALIATEDSRFYSHHGLDSIAAARAALGSIGGAGQDQGGSTLDQQLAKGLYGDGRTGLLDKGEQVVLGVKLDMAHPKSDILEMYAASVYFGHGFYGLNAAACGYFATAPAQLSWAQATLLAGLPQAPSAYDPVTHPQLARERQRHVLDRLVAVGQLTGPAADGIAAAPWDLTGSTPRPGTGCA